MSETRKDRKPEMKIEDLPQPQEEPAAEEAMEAHGGSATPGQHVDTYLKLLRSLTRF
jgi:hypothetical protein